MQINYMEPLVFNRTEIQLFTRDNACAVCGGHWRAIPYFGVDRAYCDKCKHYALEANTTSKHEIKRLENERQITSIEYRLSGADIPDKNEDILKELGF